MLGSNVKNALALSIEEKNPAANIFWQIFNFCFYALILYLPFGVALNLTSDVDLATIRILIIGFFLFWLAGVVLSGRKALNVNLQSIGLVTFLAICGVSLVFAQESSWGGRKLLFLLSIFPLYFIVEYLSQERELAERIIKFFVAAGVIAAIIGLAQFLAQFFLGSGVLTGIYVKIGPIFWGQSFDALVQANQSWFVAVPGGSLMRAFGLFPDPHMLAFFIGVTSPFILATIFFGKRIWLMLVLYALAAAVLFLTFARGGYLGWLVSAAFVLVFSWPHLNKKKRQVFIIICLLGLFAVLVFAQPVISRLASSFLLNEGSSVSRLSIWQASWQVFLSHPVFGVGLGNYPLAIDPLAVYRSSITSHNLYLDILTETGIFGLAAWLILLLGTTWQLIKKQLKSKERQREIQEMTLRIGLLGSLAYFLTHSFFETAMFNPIILAALMIILGLASATLRNSKIQIPNYK